MEVPGFITQTSRTQSKAREILRKWKIPITGFYHSLLRFIIDNMEFYYGYYGTFLKDFIDSESRHQKKKASNLRKPWKNRADLLRILRNITEITKIAITEFCGILRSMISSRPTRNYS
jgi:hypothetical protein